MYSTAQRALAEFVGTFALIFIGVGAISVAGDGGGNLTTVALGHGLAIAVMVSAVGHVSGAHFNPAVTAAAFATRKIDAALAAVYLLAQLAGATAAAALLTAALPGGSDAVAGGTPALASNVTVGQGILIEIVLTFFLVWVIFGTAMDPRGAFRKVAGLAIGFTVLLDITMGGPLTGAAMNPARAFGPALISGSWADHWIYWVAPILGGLLAGLLYDLVILRDRAQPGPGGAAAAAEAADA